ncbi:hypothetical protein CMUS01_01481 [Colletotrichum musicola]|uniref:Uncharacterized protein n=1 Tax=Colletotrichum musicola TaxID=2175873 RepID=A0A8H6NX33_9PEZI|nr:hypothetical protein CMUS01_01481 [Colletotrichum musicola]
MCDLGDGGALMMRPRHDERNMVEIAADGRGLRESRGAERCTAAPHLARGAVRCGHYLPKLGLCRLLRLLRLGICVSNPDLTCHLLNVSTATSICYHCQHQGKGKGTAELDGQVGGLCFRLFLCRRPSSLSLNALAVLLSAPEP